MTDCDFEEEFKNYGYEIGVLLGLTFGLRTKFMETLKSGRDGFFETHLDEDAKGFKPGTHWKQQLKQDELLIGMIKKHGPMPLCQLRQCSRKWFAKMTDYERNYWLNKWLEEGHVTYWQEKAYRGKIVTMIAAMV